MADETKSKIDAAAEKASENAAAQKADIGKVAEAIAADGPKSAVNVETVEAAIAAPAEEPAAEKAPASAAKTGAKKAPAKTSTKTIAAKKPAAPKPVVKQAPARKPASIAARTAENQTTNPIARLKDTIMETAENTDFTGQAKEMVAEMQERVKTVYSKAGEFASEATEFNKANIEAMVESGKIFLTGTQSIVRGDVENIKTVAETVTEDAKKVAAVKSPTEFMQLQGEMVRRNFDALVSFGSQRTETIVKLYNDAFAPISNRVSVAAEKVSKAA
jgi:phasin family protein